MPKVVVAFGPRAREIYWSGNGASLSRFATVSEVDLAAEAAGGDPTSRLESELVDADALLLCGWYGAGAPYLSAERLATMPRLRFLGCFASDRHAKLIDLDAAAKAGIQISDTSRIASAWVAEYELGLTLAALRRIPQDHTTVGAGGWSYFPDVPDEFDRIQGRRVGLTSFGAIHEHYTKLLEPFETTWEVYDPFASAERIAAAGGRKAEDLVAMAERSEILGVATPPTASTIGLVSRRVIDALPRGAVVVVVGRMIVVDEQALVERLERGELRAAIDVYDPEPPPAMDPLRHLPNVVHTPHRAGHTRPGHRAVFAELCEETRRFFAGEPIVHSLRTDLVRLVARGDVLPD